MARSDHELFAAYRSGDPAAFEEIVSRYRSPVYRYLFRIIGSAEDADDLFQETFLRVISGAGRYEERGRFAAWLFGIAHRLAVDHWRAARQRDSRSDRPVDEIESRGPPPDANVEAADVGHRIRRAVDALPEAQRRVFTLRQETDLKFREIADFTGEPLNTVLSHMRYAVMRLRRDLRDALDEEDLPKGSNE